MNFPKNVVNWYHQNGRNFPWRDTEDPYKILITEILLQRSKAEQVKEIWKTFFEKYPSPEAI